MTDKQLICNDGVKLPITEAQIKHIGLITDMMEDCHDSTEIPLNSEACNQTTMRYILECVDHLDDKDYKDYINNLIEFPSMNQETADNTRQTMALAANYLLIKPLLDLICKKIAAELTKTAAEGVDAVRKRFKIENDFTKEEEESLKKETEWLKELGI